MDRLRSVYSIRNSALNSYDSGWDCTTIIISCTVQSPMFFYVLLYICTLTLLHVGALIELNAMDQLWIDCSLL